MYIPDFMITAYSSKEGYPQSWCPGSGPYLGCELPIENAGPLISPFDSAYLGPASYDIGVGLKFASPSKLRAFVMNGSEAVRTLPMVNEIDGARERLRPNEEIEIALEPGQPVLCHSLEYVRIPPHLAGMLSMRSSFARDWLDHSAADSIWPGFQGQITFELRNHGPRHFHLRSGMRPLQLAFARMAATPERPYAGIYQKQKGQLHSLKDKEASL